MPSASNAGLDQDLRAIVQDPSSVNTGESARRVHGEAFVDVHAPRLPDVVVSPETVAEVAEILKLASGRGIPVVPYGAGTSAEGETIPVRGGIALDLTRMRRIDLHIEDMQATVGAGVTRTALAAKAGEHGLFFPVDPGADATLGGMAATNASGTTTVRYGGMRTNVLELEVVLADGRTIRAGSRALKSSAGYNLAQLFIGSEGTLGVITAVTVRLYGIPDHVVAVRAAFPTLDAACSCCTAMFGDSGSLTRVELLDATSIESINAYKGTDFPESPHLLIELSGNQAAVEGDLAAVRELAEASGCVTFEATSNHAERARLWAARHELGFAMTHAHPGLAIKGTDTCVPISALASAVEHARITLEKAGFPAAIVGHVGDGNYHAVFMVDTSDADVVERMEAANDAIVDYALTHGGTCSGEHGIGLGKIGYLEQEHGDLLPLMRGIKSLLDPSGILNPGKIFVPETGRPGASANGVEQ
jgi:D-lactate dehydrogenase (cytochrome)